MKTNLIVALFGVVLAGVVGYFAYDYGHTAGRAEGLAAVSSFFGDQQRFPAGANPNRQGGGQNTQG
ncbi:MAG: hypothetical protein LC737_10940, partial [Chloroflexi bacterium]|nr:hypothetical protein [Chloroflexota bacterium]